MADGHGAPASDLKTCITCGETKALETFKIRKTSKDGRTGECRKCVWVREKKRREKPEVKERMWASQRERRKRNYDPQVARDHNLRSKHRITLVEYELMARVQGGVCAICESDGGGSKPLAVDHDHACCDGRAGCGGCLRGLLCEQCNKGLGHFADSIDRLLNAVTYLEVWDGEWTRRIPSAG